MIRFARALACFALLLLRMHTAHAAPASMGITVKPWGTTPSGQSVSLYTLTNKHGVQARITNYGGTLVSLLAPDHRGRLADVTLGYDTLGGYVKDIGGTYFGALVGRYANRIARGRYVLDGTPYAAYVNNPPNSLHGGRIGFNKKVWTAVPHGGEGSPALTLRTVSPDGDEGYPGTLTVQVTYTLRDDNALQIDYAATTDKDTVVNLTNHAYWNLNGAGSGPVLTQVMQINADKFLPIDKTSIPLGEPEPVAGTPFDFRHPTPIGARIGSKDTQIANGAGYDHTFIVSGTPGTLRLAARAYSPQSGRVLSMLTTEPGVQFYTGNFLGKQVGKGNRLYVRRSGFALEAQHFPDSPNHPRFPTTELRPGQTYRQTTVYAFSTR